MIKVKTLNPNQQKSVLIFHGLFMKSPVMNKMANCFSRNGYTVYNITYNSRNISINVLLGQVSRLVENHDISHIVGHSLGGLLIRQLFYSGNFKHKGAVFTLGTPHNGSAVARYFNDKSIRWIFGNATDHGLLGQITHSWNYENKLYNIAGIKHIGPLMALPPLRRGTGDGTVLLHETKLKGTFEYKRFNTTHTFMIYSNKVLKYILIKMKESEPTNNT